MLVTTDKLMSRPSVMQSAIAGHVASLRDACRNQLVTWLTNFAVIGIMGILAVSYHVFYRTLNYGWKNDGDAASCCYIAR